MAGIEVNPKSVLRNGQSSLSRGYIPGVSQQQSTLQTSGTENLTNMGSRTNQTSRSQSYGVSSVQTLPRNPQESILSSNLTQTLPNRSSGQNLVNHHNNMINNNILTSHHNSRLPQLHHNVSQNILQQQQQQQFMKQQPLTSQQLLQQQILLRQLKPTPTSQSQEQQLANSPKSVNKNGFNSTANKNNKIVPKSTAAEKLAQGYQNTTCSSPAPATSTVSLTQNGSVNQLSKQALLLKQQQELQSSVIQLSQQQAAGKLSQQQQLVNQLSQHQLHGQVSQHQLVNQLSQQQLPGQLSQQQLLNQLSQQQLAGQISQQQLTSGKLSHHQITSHLSQQQLINQLSQHSTVDQLSQQTSVNQLSQQPTVNQLSQQALSMKAQQEQLEQLLAQQRLNEEEMMLAKLQGVMLEGQSGSGPSTDRTYMNVQPVAVIGRGGKIVNQSEFDTNPPPTQVPGPTGRKAPAIPKSQEVKHKKEPLYSTILQFSANDGSKGMHVFDDGVYANYAPASLYSNYSNYSELEALRSTDSQCSAEEEPTEGLPSLDSPVSSSYSELRQAATLVQPRVSFNGDGSIYEPVLPPKGIPGPNSIHFKSLSGGSTDSDYFGACVKCGGKIVGDGNGCSAMGRLYHVQCFTCAECGIVLQGLPFYAVEGSALCETDYLNTLEKCCKCLKPILDRILRATGKPYHPACFTCIACNKSLDGVPFTVDATNQIHCIQCFHKRFAPRCSVCKDPIMPTPGEEETVRVVALDRSFHINCYRCVDCNLLLSSDEDGRGCYPLDDTVLCRQCNTTRIHKLTSSIQD